MSLITGVGTDFTQLTVSFWFRIPSAGFTEGAVQDWPMMPTLLAWGKRTGQLRASDGRSFAWKFIGDTPASGPNPNPDLCFLGGVNSSDPPSPDPPLQEGECWRDNGSPSGDPTIPKPTYAPIGFPNSTPETTQTLSYITLSALTGHLQDATVAVPSLAVMLCLNNNVDVTNYYNRMLSAPYLGNTSNRPHDFMPKARFQNSFPCGAVARAIALPGGAFLFNSWHHLLISVDLSGDDSVQILTSESESWNITINKSIDIVYDGVVLNGGRYYVTCLNDDVINPTCTANGAACSTTGGFAQPQIAADSDGSHTEEWAASSGIQPKIEFAYTQIWFSQYIDATDPSNQSKFFTVSGSRIKPPTQITAAQQTFGASDVWCYRNKQGGILYQDNHGTAGPVSVIGTPLADYFPGPGQTATIPRFSLQQMAAQHRQRALR